MDQDVGVVQSDSTGYPLLLRTWPAKGSGMWEIRFCQK